MNFDNDKIEFREIVLGHLKRILDLSCSEMRDGTKTVSSGNKIEVVVHEDTRISYIQAIENLSFVLLPHFDSQTKKVYETTQPILSGLHFEVKEKLKETYDKMCKDSGLEKINSKSFIVQLKLRSAKELFCELNLLLHRNNYLKKSVFGESLDNDNVIEDEDEGDKE